MPNFVAQSDRFQPATTFVDSLSLALADAAAYMSSRAFVDCAATRPCFILDDVWRDLHRVALSYEALVSKPLRKSSSLVEPSIPLAFSWIEAAG